MIMHDFVIIFNWIYLIFMLEFKYNLDIKKDDYMQFVTNV